jgi:hypothetical protein
MRKILLATAALAMLGGPVMAQDTTIKRIDKEEAEGFGAAAGGTTGAIAGAVVGGPIGAIIGGFAGAVLGAESAVPDEVVQYAVANPVEFVEIEGGVSAGATVPESVTLYEIPDQPEYRYIYADGRPIIVEAETRQIVYSPGYVLPEQTVTYIESNPVEPVTIEGEVTVGTTLPGDIELREIPDNSRFAYVYVEDRPVLVERDSRTIVWLR